MHFCSFCQYSWQILIIMIECDSFYIDFFHSTIYFTITSKKNENYFPKEIFLILYIHAMNNNFTSIIAFESPLILLHINNNSKWQVYSHVATERNCIWRIASLPAHVVHDCGGEGGRKGGSRNAIIRINIAGPVVRIRGNVAGRTQDHFKVVCGISRGSAR